MKRNVLLFVLLCAAYSARATVLTPDTRTKLYDVLEMYPYAVMHYINYEQVGDDKTKRLALPGMKSTFRASSNESAHVLAGIRFIGANSDREPALISQYDLSGDFSTVLLFKDGQPFKDKDGNIIKLTGAFDQEDLGNFIQEHFGNYIARKVQEAEARRITERPSVQYVTREVVRERPTYYPRYYRDYYPGYYGYGYPYYGYGPRFGFGIGFGGRRRRGGFYFGF